MSKKVTAPAQVSKVSTLADGSVKLEVITQELPANEMATLFDLRKDMGWFLFASNPLVEQDVPDEKAEVGQKTQSQRLRGALYVLWEQRNKPGTFETFYRTNLENIINRVKEELDD